MIDIPGDGLLVGIDPVITGATATTNDLVDAANERYTLAIIAAPGGNIRNIGFYIQTVTTPPTSNHTIRVETVNATTGQPTGSLVAANTEGSIALTTTGFKIVTLTADASPALGTSIAIVLQAPATNFGSIRPVRMDSMISYLPYPIQVGGTKILRTPVVMLQRDDGTVPPVGTYVTNDFTTVTFGSGSSPNRVATRFRLPFGCRIKGAIFNIDPDNPADLIFYASDGITPIPVYTFTSGLRASGTVAGNIRFDFTTPITINANAWYRLAVVPTTASNLNLTRINFDDSAYKYGMFKGGDFEYSTVTGVPSAEGDWTNVDTQTLYCGLILDQIESSSGGGGEFSSVAIG